MNTSSTISSGPAGSDHLPEPVLKSILDSLHGLRFGQVTVIVQDGRVIQIDRTERHRFTSEKESR
ncbi:MAG: YezD family protein [Planctomycetes bacterium]|nr:YezD family protein [Planctomycetota bacterium]